MMEGEGYSKLRLFLTSLVGSLFLGAIVALTYHAVITLRIHWFDLQFDVAFRQSGSSLAEKSDNLQYDLAFAKANLAGDEVEVKNSIARLKEMDLLLHAPKASKTASVYQLRQERNVLLDKSREYAADSDMIQMKMQKEKASHSAAVANKAKSLEIQEQDDNLLAEVLDRKASRVKQELR
jgi:hypothetical protein